MKKTMSGILTTFICLTNTIVMAILVLGINGISLTDLLSTVLAEKASHSPVLYYERPIEGKVLSSYEIPEEGSVVTTVEISSAMSQIGELATCSYSYSGIRGRNDSRVVFDYSIPFTENTVEVAYEGVIRAGYIVSDIDFELDQEGRTITVILPEVQVFSNEITDYDDLCDDNVLNRIPPEAISDLIMEAKEGELNEAVENGLYLDAYNNAQTVIEETIGQICDYEIRFIER